MNIYKFYSNPSGLIQLDTEKIPNTAKFNAEVAFLLDIGAIQKPFTVQGSLYPEDVPLELPDDLTVQGSLYLTDTLIKSLPDNLHVGGDLYLTNTPNLDKDNLPSSLVVSGKIYL